MTQENKPDIFCDSRDVKKDSYPCIILGGNCPFPYIPGYTCPHHWSSADGIRHSLRNYEQGIKDATLLNGQNSELVEPVPPLKGIGKLFPLATPGKYVLIHP